MPDGMDFIMRPVLRGMCSYGDIASGLLDLCDLADMNDALTISDYNQWVAEEAVKPKR